jgi:putative transposase
MAIVARNLTDYVDGLLVSKQYLILDRDTKFTKRVKGILEDAGVKVKVTPFRAPNANAHAERFVQSIKHQCIDKMILLGARSIDRAHRESTKHYLREKPHQGLGNNLIREAPGGSQGETEVTDRLGGLLKFYSRAA